MAWIVLNQEKNINIQPRGNVMSNMWRKLFGTAALAFMLCLAWFVMFGTAFAQDYVDNGDGTVSSFGTNEVTRYQSSQRQIVASLLNACNHCKSRCKSGYFPGEYCPCVLENCEMECGLIPECRAANQDMDECIVNCNYNLACQICCIEFATNASQGNCKDCYETYKQCFSQSSGTCAENFNICKYQYHCPNVYFTHICKTK